MVGGGRGEGGGGRRRASMTRWSGASHGLPPRLRSCTSSCTCLSQPDVWHLSRRTKVRKGTKSGGKGRRRCGGEARCRRGAGEMRLRCPGRHLRRRDGGDAAGVQARCGCGAKCGDARARHGRDVRRSGDVRLGPASLLEACEVRQVEGEVDALVDDDVLRLRGRGGDTGEIGARLYAGARSGRDWVRRDREVRRRAGGGEAGGVEVAKGVVASSPAPS